MKVKRCNNCEDKSIVIKRLIDIIDNYYCFFPKHIKSVVDKRIKADLNLNFKESDNGEGKGD